LCTKVSSVQKESPRHIPAPAYLFTYGQEFLPSFRRKPESRLLNFAFRAGLLDPGFRRGDDHACGVTDPVLFRSTELTPRLVSPA